MLKKMEQAKKKAEAVVNTVDISEREKMAQLKRCDITAHELTLQLHETKIITGIEIIFSLCLFFKSLSQHLQESRPGQGEERGNICGEQKGSW